MNCLNCGTRVESNDIPCPRCGFVSSTIAPARSVDPQPRQQAARPWPENGGFLVIGPPDQAAINPTLYGKLFRQMLGCTFPVTGVPDVAKQFCGGYSPERKGPHCLVREWGGQGIRFIFMPRTVLGLLYHVFINLEMPGHQIGDTFVSQDHRMVMAHQKGSVSSYFAEVIEEQIRFSDHYANFNAWATAFLSRPNRAEKSGVQKESTGDHRYTQQITAHDINEPPLDFHRRLVVRLANYGKLSPAVTASCLRMTEFECLMPDHTFLTRFAWTIEDTYPTYDPGKKERDLLLESAAGGAAAKAKVTSQAPAATKSAAEGASARGRPATLTPRSYSQSFSSDIFAGCMSREHASTFQAIGGEKSCYLVPISIADYKAGRGVASCFWIPPYPALVQTYSKMNELWHPRTRIFPRSNPDGKRQFSAKEQFVAGISDYSLQGYKWDYNIELIRFMWYPQKLTDEQVLGKSVEVEHYLRTRSFVLCAANFQAHSQQSTYWPTR